MSAREFSAQRRKLSPLVAQLSRLSSARFAFALAFDWLGIALAVALSEWAQSPLVYFCSILWIGSRQHALLVLSHEGAHFRIATRQRVNDWVSDLFCAFPIFFDTKIYRRTHFAHHQFLNSAKDPDWTRKVVHEDWQFPKTRAALGLLLVRYAAWSGPFEWLRAAVYFSGFSKRELAIHAGRVQAVQKVMFWLGCAALLVFSARGLERFAFYWLMPYFFVFPTLQRLRSIAEHFGLKNEWDLDQSRDMVVKPIEAFFFAPHNVGLHLTHHLFSGVPFYNLPRLHRQLMCSEPFRSKAQQNSTYIGSQPRGLLADLTQSKDAVEHQHAG